MKTEHTPTPWVLGNKGQYFRRIIGGNFIVADVNIADRGKGESEREANAAFIVRACNAHDDLVQFLFDAIPYIEEGEKFNKPNGKRLSTQIRNYLREIGEKI